MGWLRKRHPSRVLPLHFPSIFDHFGRPRILRRVLKVASGQKCLHFGFQFGRALLFSMFTEPADDLKIERNVIVASRLYLYAAL